MSNTDDANNKPQTLDADDDSSSTLSTVITVLWVLATTFTVAALFTPWADGALAVSYFSLGDGVTTVSISLAGAAADTAPPETVFSCDGFRALNGASGGLCIVACVAASIIVLIRIFCFLPNVCARDTADTNSDTADTSGGDTADTSSATAESSTARLRIVLGVLAVLASTISWSLTFVLFATSHCGTTSLSRVPDVRIGPSAPLQIIGWFLAFVALIVDDRVNAKTSVEEAVKAVCTDLGSALEKVSTAAYVWILATALLMAALGSPWATFANPTDLSSKSRIDIGFFSSARAGPATNGTLSGCAPFSGTNDAAAAFGILSTLLAGCLAMLGLFADRSTEFPRARVVLGVSLVVGTVLFMALSFALFDGLFCTDGRVGNAAGAAVGPAGPLATIACVTAIVAAVIDFLEKEGKETTWSSITTEAEYILNKVTRVTVVLAIGWLVATVLVTAAVALPWAVYDDTATKTTKLAGFFSTEIQTLNSTVKVPADVFCPAHTSARQAAAAFGILSILLGFAVSIATLRDDQPALERPWPRGLGTAFVVTSLLCFSLTFALFSAPICASVTVSDAPTAMVGAAGPLALVGCVFGTVMLAMDLVVGNESEFGRACSSFADEVERVRFDVVLPAIFWSVALVFFVAATATPWLVLKRTYTLSEALNLTQTVTTSVGFFHAVTASNTSQNTTRTSALLAPCRDFSNTSNAAAALVLLSLIFAASNIFLNLWPAARDFKKSRVAIAVVLFLVSLIAWAMTFALFDSTYCGVRVADDSNARLGPSGPLTLSGWVVVAISACVQAISR